MCAERMETGDGGHACLGTDKELEELLRMPDTAVMLKNDNINRRRGRNSRWSAGFRLVGVLPLLALLGVSRVWSQDHALLLFTNNNNGIAEVCDCGEDPLGGLARRKSFFDSVSSTALRLDAGDFLDAFGFSPPKDELVIGLYRQLQYEAIGVGDQEFANGLSFVPRWLGPLPVTSVNVPAVSGASIPRERIVRKGGVSFGIVSHLPWSSFLYFHDKKLLPWTDWGDGISELRKKAAELRSRVDMIIVLSHAGYEEDVEWVKKVPGVDVIVGSHSQTEVTEPTVVGGTTIVQAGGGGTHVGILELTKSQGIWRVVRHRLVPMDSSIPENPDFKRRIEIYQSSKKSR